MGRRGAAAAQAAPDLQPQVSSAPPSTPQPPPNMPSGAAHAPSLPVPTARRNPVRLSRPAPSRGARCAEVAGDTAAGCAAVCCCCPCGLLNLLLLAAVKLPAGLCRRAILKQKKRWKRKGDGTGSVGNTTRRVLLGHRVGDAWEDDDDEEFVVFAGRAGPVVVGPGAKGLLVGAAVGWPAATSPSQEVSEMDKEMWAHFYGAGFWRSVSQRDV